jgi:hypothetical protein
MQGVHKALLFLQMEKFDYTRAQRVPKYKSGARFIKITIHK